MNVYNSPSLSQDLNIHTLGENWWLLHQERDILWGQDCNTMSFYQKDVETMATAVIIKCVTLKVGKGLLHFVLYLLFASWPPSWIAFNRALFLSFCSVNYYCQLRPETDFDSENWFVPYISNPSWFPSVINRMSCDQFVVMSTSGLNYHWYAIEMSTRQTDD